MKFKNKFLKKLTALAMASLMTISTLGATVHAGPGDPEIKVVEETGEGSVSIRPRIMNQLDLPTENQPTPEEMNKPLAGTVGYELYLVARYDEATGKFIGDDGEEYTALNFEESNFKADDQSTYIGKVRQDGVMEDEKGIYKLNSPDAGKIDFTKLPLGRYIARQIVKNSGTVKDNNFMFDIPGYSVDPETGKVDENTFTNDIVVYPKNTLVLSNLTIKKVDGETNLHVGAKISIEKTEGTKVASDTLKEFDGRFFVQSEGQTIFTVGEQGFKLASVEPGTYAVREVMTDQAYSLNTSVMKIKVANDGKVSLVDPAKDFSYTLVNAEEENTLIIKNYKKISNDSVDKVLADNANTTEGGNVAFFETFGRGQSVDYKIELNVPKNIRDYKDLKIADNPELPMIFEKFGEVSYNGQKLDLGTEYEVAENVVTIKAEGISKIADIAETLQESAKLVVNVTVKLSTENIDWEKATATNSVKITFTVKENPTEEPTDPTTPDKETPEEIDKTSDSKMSTGKLEITKTLNKKKGDAKASDAEFKIYREVFRKALGDEVQEGENQKVTEWLLLEKREDGVWYPTGVAESEEAATVLKADGDESELKANTIKVFGLLVSDESTNDHAQYFVKETKAPTGYTKINKAVDGSVTAEQLNATVTIENRVAADLPVTGGLGVAIGLGLISVLGVAAVYVEMKKKKAVAK